MIKAVIFDLGGVYFEDGTKKFIGKLSQILSKPEESLFDLFRKGKSVEYRENKISGDEFFQFASEKLESKISASEINNMWVSEYTEIPGTKKVIEKLKSMGLKVSVISDNVPERINYLEEKYNFLDIFDDVILSYEVNLTKPSEEIFKLALSRLEVLPSECVFVDDRQVNLDTSTRLEINSILFENPDQLEKEIDTIIQSKK